MERGQNANDGHNASTAARVVGYESPSQFSREYKRLFGMTPVEEAEQTRAFYQFAGDVAIMKGGAARHHRLWHPARVSDASVR